MSRTPQRSPERSPERFRSPRIRRNRAATRGIALWVAILLGAGWILLSPSAALADDDPAPPAVTAPAAEPLSDEALPALVRAFVAGDAAAEKTLRAQGAAIVPRVRPLLGDSGVSTLRKLIDGIARDALRRSIAEEGSVRYRGQFAALAALGLEGAEVLLTLFADEDAPLDLRNRAATALGDVGGAPQIPPLRRLADDFLTEEWVERETKFLLARFGDRTLVDQLLAEQQAIASKELGAATLPAILTAHGLLAEIHYRIDEYDLAIEHYLQKQALLAELVARVRPELRLALEEEIDLLQYNLACSFALAGKVDEALAALERSMASREITLEMLRTDGDLRSVRADPRYAAWLADRGRERERGGEGTPTPENPGDPEEPRGEADPPSRPGDGEEEGRVPPPSPGSGLPSHE